MQTATFRGHVASIPKLRGPRTDKLFTRPTTDPDGAPSEEQIHLRPFLTFRLAVHGEPTQFFDIKSEDVGRNISFLRPGDYIEVHGAFQVRTWTDKDGTPRTSPQIDLAGTRLLRRKPAPQIP